MSPLFISLVLLGLHPAYGYIWPPSQPMLDTLESARWDQDGYKPATEFASGLNPCDSFLQEPTAGRSNAGDWLRAAYHDMATHDAAAGTGGLDASIRFAEERARGENAGDGFTNTFLFVDGDRRHLSLADGLALAALVAVEHCGGPEIAFRGGRVDADAPNAPGVPEPQQPLEDHISNFARQGFNATDMIALVACGHTFGGVQRSAFPDIAPDLRDPNNTSSNARFDSTFTHFDNKIATEYIDGTTTNPLVAGHNVTTRSDLRIFASDNNVTMSRFAQSEELFMSTCATLFARMLDTVPRGVQLTEVLEPLPVKPRFALEYAGNNTLHLTGEVRFWELPENPRRSVRMRWTDRSGSEKAAPLSHTPDMVSTALGGRRWGLWYNVSSPFFALDATAAMGAVRFEIDEGDGAGEPRVEDQHGLGFVLQDTIMWAASTCTVFGGEQGLPSAGRFDIAIRRGANPTRVWLEANVPLFTREDKPGIVVVEVPAPVSGEASNEAYDVWSVDVEGIFKPFTALVQVGDTVIETPDTRGLFSDIPECA